MVARGGGDLGGAHRLLRAPRAAATRAMTETASAARDTARVIVSMLPASHNEEDRPPPDYLSGGGLSYQSRSRRLRSGSEGHDGGSEAIDSTNQSHTLIGEQRHSPALAFDFDNLSMHTPVEFEILAQPAIRLVRLPPFF